MGGTDELVDEADALGFCRGNRAPREQHVERAR